MTLRGRSVCQDWVLGLSFMQQSVLMSGVRGPDTVRKDHAAKVLMRWYRRCVLYSAFESQALEAPFAFLDPGSPGGGSFTGPIYDIATLRDEYLRNVDEVPHHFHLHLVHGAEIIGYKHPDTAIRTWWYAFYADCVRDMHLRIESEPEMDARLGDNEAGWRAGEAVTAR